jgi:hypothetical protein
MPKGAGVTQRAVSILIEADEAAHAALCALQTAYSDRCNVVETRCWNRYSLHKLGFVAYKAAEFGIVTIFIHPAYTSETCSGWGEIGLRAKHRFDCKCGRRAHSDVNAVSNLAGLGESALSPRAYVSRPYVIEIGHPNLGQ